MSELETTTWERTVKVEKVDDERRLVFGWMSVAVDKDGSLVEDSQGDVIYPEDLEEAAYRHVLEARVGGEMHKRKVGRLVESLVVTPEKAKALGIPEDAPVPRCGWWAGYRIDDDDAWEGVKSGRLQAFSIGGFGRRVDDGA